MAKISRPVMYGGIGVLAVAAWVLTTPDDASGIKPLDARRSQASSQRQEAVQFTQADYEAVFPAIELRAPDAFRPLVVRDRSENVNLPNAIPSAFAGGESGWIYTGTATVDGVPMALVENIETLDGTFLVHGDRWKGSTVSQITPQSLLLTGPGGDRIKLRIVGYDEIGEGDGMIPFNISPSMVGPLSPDTEINIEPIDPDDVTTNTELQDNAN